MSHLCSLSINIVLMIAVHIENGILDIKYTFLQGLILLLTMLTVSRNKQFSSNKSINPKMDMQKIVTLDGFALQPDFLVRKSMLQFGAWLPKRATTCLTKIKSSLTSRISSGSARTPKTILEKKRNFN